MKLIEWALVAVLVLLVVVIVAMQGNEAQAAGPVGVEIVPAPTGTLETLYIDLAWGQKMYVRCSEDPAKDAQPVGEIGAVSFGAEVWGVTCYPPGTNERLETGD